MLEREARRRLDRLAKERLQPIDAAWRLLEYHENDCGRKPLEAILIAENEAWEMGLSLGDEFWDQVVGALEQIRDADEPEATLYFSDSDQDGDPEYPYTIGRYHDHTEGQFEVEWVSVDRWRGYYAVRPAAESDWIEVHDDAILAGSEDERALKAFDDALRAAMDQRGIVYVRAFGRTSNLFSRGYTVFVEQGREGEVAPIIDELKTRYRNARFLNAAVGWERLGEGA